MRVSSLAILLLLGCHANAQQVPLYGNWNINPQMVNPAMCGDQGDMLYIHSRVSAWQIPGAPRFNALSLAILPSFSSPAKKGTHNYEKDIIAIGGVISTNSLGHMRESMFSPQFAFSGIRFDDDNNWVSLGVSLDIFLKQIAFQDLVADDPTDGVLYPDNASLWGMNTTFGAVYNYKNLGETFELFQFGMAVHQLFPNRLGYINYQSSLAAYYEQQREFRVFARARWVFNGDEPKKSVVVVPSFNGAFGTLFGPVLGGSVLVGYGRTLSFGIGWHSNSMVEASVRVRLNERLLYRQELGILANNGFVNHGVDLKVDIGRSSEMPDDDTSGVNIRLRREETLIVVIGTLNNKNVADSLRHQIQFNHPELKIKVVSRFDYEKNELKHLVYVGPYSSLVKARNVKNKLKEDGFLPRVRDFGEW